MVAAGLVLCPADDRGWMRLVDAHPDATPFHLPAWSRVVTQTYGFPSFVLRTAGMRIDAGMPLVQVTDLFGRRRLVSLPFTDHCPPLLEESNDALDFIEALRRWRTAASAGPLEVRAQLPGHEGTHVVGTRHVLGLEKDSAAVFRRLHRNRIQKRVRRARELGVEITLGRSEDDLAAFYRLHCRTRRRQGVPVQPRRFIERIWENLIDPGHGFVLLARKDGIAIATALFLSWNQNLIYKYGASDPAHWRLGANFLIHWSAIEWGCTHGCETYDFGRTDAGHESLREFKAAWGASELPLVYTHMGASPRAMGGGPASKAIAGVIKRSPTVVCRALGELLYRYAA